MTKNGNKLTYEPSLFARLSVRNGSDLPKKSFLSNLQAWNWIITESCNNDNNAQSTQTSLMW